jgi:DNA-binding transcriptional LysR family regulator
MEIRQLKYFLAVADQRSFVNAANVLFISRQAVSKAVAQLETELGVELFMRDSNGAFLTPGGVLFYDRIRSSVMDFEQIRAEMLDYGARYHQRVRLAFAVGTLCLYEQALERYREGQENVAIDYAEYPESRCAQLLQERQADLAVCTEPPEDSLLAESKLDAPPYVVLFRAQDTPQAGAIGLEALRQLSLAWLSETPALTDACERAGVHPRYTGCDYFRLMLLAREGKCALLLPEPLAKLAGPEFRYLPLEEPLFWQISCVYLRSLENNVLYRTTIDELRLQVFGRKKEDTP